MQGRCFGEVVGTWPARQLLPFCAMKHWLLNRVLGPALLLAAAAPLTSHAQTLVFAGGKTRAPRHIR